MKKIIIFFSLFCLLGFLFAQSLVKFYSNRLPSVTEIIEYRPKTISTVLDRNEQILGFFYLEKREFISINNIPELVKHAFISAEDKNFYRHSGYDIFGLLKAVIDFFKGAKLRGASTITQQVTKGFLLSGERSFERKIRELILAIQLENVLTKSEILEIYLNEVYLGEGSYGVSAAAETYFSKNLEELLPREAAYLAALPKSPEVYNPITNPENAILRRNFVLDEMVQNGYLESNQLDVEKNSKLQTVLSGEISGGKNLEPFRGFLAEEVRSQLNTELGERFVNQGGFRIRTSIDSHLQKIASKALKLEIESLNLKAKESPSSIAHIEVGHKDKDIDWLAELEKKNLVKPNSGWNLAVVVGTDADNLLVMTDRSSKIEKLHFVPGVKQNLSIGSVIYVQDKSDLYDPAPIWFYMQKPLFDGGIAVLDLETGDILALEGGYNHQSSSLNNITKAKRPRLEFLIPVFLAAASEQFSDENVQRNFEDIFKYPTTDIQKDLLDDSSISILMDFGFIEENPDSLENLRVAREVTIIDIMSAYNMLVTGRIKKPGHVLIEVFRGEKKVYPRKAQMKKCKNCKIDKQVFFDRTNDEIGSQSFMSKVDENPFGLSPLKYFDAISESDTNDEVLFIGKHHTNAELYFDSVVGIFSNKMFGCHIEANKSNLDFNLDIFSGSCLSLIERILRYGINEAGSQ